MPSVPGLVIAEIQQRSDATFRLFDHGRQRELHVDNAVAAANAGPAACQSVPRRLTDARTLLVASPHFVLERIDLSPQSNWELHAEHETWVLVLDGHARVGLMTVFVGEAIFLEADRTSIKVGSDGLKGLLAYLGTEPSPSLLHNHDGQNVGSPIRHLSSSRPSSPSNSGFAGPLDGGTTVTQLSRLAFIGNSLPRRCGIATFTTDLQQAISTSFAHAETCIVAMNDHGHAYDYPSVVRLQVNDDRIEDYVHAADVLNAGQFDVVSLQHEFGIFGGEAGDHIMALLSRLTMPIVTTLHTVLSGPTPVQRGVLDRIVDASSSRRHGRERAELLCVYRVPRKRSRSSARDSRLRVRRADQARPIRLQRQAVILTFGLLSPNKGIEVMIDAMPRSEKPSDAVYVVLGTHPISFGQGEAYRESLARARELGVEDHVVFLDQFVDQATLLGFISMCDVYVTPYLNEAQMTSGTLAYSFGLGKAVVSTPYWHARELLADGRGILVPFGDATAVGSEIAGLLTDDARRQAMRKRAYASSRSMTWERTAERYLTAFESARRGHRIRVIARLNRSVPSRGSQAPPEMQIGHLLSMCDDTGLFQHAVHSVPDRSHGYCVDDNARALLLACSLNNPGEQRLSEVLTARLAAFVQHAWNPDTSRFRNFMSFDRRWLEDRGSEDSHGRTLWALGECARSDASPSRRRWAASLFAEALPTAESFRSPRAWAFTLLGLDAYCAAVTDGLPCRACPASPCRQVDFHNVGG